MLFTLLVGGTAAGSTPADASTIELGPAGPVLILGDSLSAAYNIPVDSGWVALLDDRLNDRLRPAPKVINASISGETSAGGLSRLPALLAEHSPAVVVIELGGNDGLRGLPPGQFRDNLDAMIAMSRETGAKVLLLGIDIPPNYGRAYRDRFTAVYRDLAGKHEVPLVPFVLEGAAGQPEMMQPDGIHPTAKAQPIVMETVWTALWPLLAGDRKRR